MHYNDFAIKLHCDKFAKEIHWKVLSDFKGEVYCKNFAKEIH